MLILPPETEEQLLDRAEAIAGLTLSEVAERTGLAVPPDLRRHKGWTGELLERQLGADAGSLAEPDFRAIGVELKTLPVDARGLPRESTYVCTVPLEEGLGQTWESSWVRRKLARVLWIPVEADPALPLPERRIGTPLLWSPDRRQEALLRRDWEELMEMVCLGELEKITARIGEVMQIRPKAANSRVRRGGIGSEGDRILTNPRGFYLRAGFTREILRRYYVLPQG